MGKAHVLRGDPDDDAQQTNEGTNHHLALQEDARRTVCTIVKLPALAITGREGPAW